MKLSSCKIENHPLFLSPSSINRGSNYHPPKWGKKQRMGWRCSQNICYYVLHCCTSFKTHIFHKELTTTLNFLKRKQSVVASNSPIQPLLHHKQQVHRYQTCSLIIPKSHSTIEKRYFTVDSNGKQMNKMVIFGKQQDFFPVVFEKNRGREKFYIRHNLSTAFQIFT